MANPLEIPPLRLAAYRAAAVRKRAEQEPEIRRRMERAWAAARGAAAMLKSRFGATRVVAFGSLVRKDCFTLWSDVDLAAWGIPPNETFRAIGASLDVDSQIEVNLVVVGTCRPALLAAIEREGVDL